MALSIVLCPHSWLYVSALLTDIKMKVEGISFEGKNLFSYLATHEEEQTHSQISGPNRPPATLGKPSYFLSIRPFLSITTSLSSISTVPFIFADTPEQETPALAAGEVILQYKSKWGKETCI